MDTDYVPCLMNLLVQFVWKGDSPDRNAGTMLAVYCVPLQVKKESPPPPNQQIKGLTNIAGQTMSRKFGYFRIFKN
jgi:hypothetical protein